MCIRHCFLEGEETFLSPVQPCFKLNHCAGAAESLLTSSILPPAMSPPAPFLIIRDLKGFK